MSKSQPPVSLKSQIPKDWMEALGGHKPVFKWWEDPDTVNVIMALHGCGYTSHAIWKIVKAKLSIPCSKDKVHDVIEQELRK